jgi:hypothetical protein
MRIREGQGGVDKYRRENFGAGCYAIVPQQFFFANGPERGWICPQLGRCRRHGGGIWVSVRRRAALRTSDRPASRRCGPTIEVGKPLCFLKLEGV